MESKYVTVKLKDAEAKIEYYTSFGWTLVGDMEELPGGKIGLSFERNRKELASFDKIRNAEKAYAEISRPFPLLGFIFLGIASILLALYFVLQKSFQFYIVFLFTSLVFFGLTIYMMIIFLIVAIKRKGLQKKIIKNVGIEAGTIRSLPLKNNIERETDDTWLIANNL